MLDYTNSWERKKREEIVMEKQKDKDRGVNSMESERSTQRKEIKTVTKQIVGRKQLEALCQRGVSESVPISYHLNIQYYFLNFGHLKCYFAFLARCKSSSFHLLTSYKFILFPKFSVFFITISPVLFINLSFYKEERKPRGIPLPNADRKPFQPH